MITPLIQQLLQSSNWFQTLPLFMRKKYEEIFAKLDAKDADKLANFLKAKLQEEQSILNNLSNTVHEAKTYLKTETRKIAEHKSQKSEESLLNSLIQSL